MRFLFTKYLLQRELLTHKEKSTRLEYKTHSIVLKGLPFRSRQKISNVYPFVVISICCMVVFFTEREFSRWKL